MMTTGGDGSDRSLPGESSRSTAFRVARALAHPYASDQPEAVRGPWRAVLVRDDLTIGFDQWMVDDATWATEGPVRIGVVRGTASPMDTDDNGVGTMPNIYRPADALFMHEGLEGDEAIARWAQARLVAALLNANQEKLDQLAEWESR